MTHKPDGGPAFPRTPYPDNEAGRDGAFTAYAQDGMSLRDWFVGQMLAGRNGWATDTPKVYYERADKLLAEKEKLNDEP